MERNGMNRNVVSTTINPPRRLPAAFGSTLTRPQINDILIRGYLLSIDKGSAVERFAGTLKETILK